VSAARSGASGIAPQPYRCPVHGEFTRDVPLDDVPDRVACERAYHRRRSDLTGWHTRFCGEMSILRRDVDEDADARTCGGEP
jgi:hypothetical protein